MKKVLISATVVLVLIAGFVVGQTQLKDEPKLKAARYSTDFSDGGTSYGSDSNEIPGSNSDSADASLVKPSRNEAADSTSGKVYNCGPTEDCAYTIDPVVDPDPTGNPLSKFIVKTGTVSVTIPKDSLTEKYDKLVTVVKADGGYIEQDTSKEHSSTITVRIPADKLDSTLVSLRKLGKLKSQSLSSSDQAFTVKDYEARLKVMQQRKDVLTASLAKANANDTQYIQEQIFQLQTEIESITGQQELVNDQIAMSTLTITMNEKGTKEVIEDEKQSLIEKSWEKSSKSFLTSIGGILIVIAATFPFLIVGLIIVVAVKRSISKRKADKTLEKE